MEQIIYADTLFIINFSMDFLALFLSGKILFARMRTVPLLLAASLGALYAVASLFLPGNGVITFLINLAVPIVMCMIVFGYHPGVLIRAVLLYFGISLLFGGGMTVIFLLINRGMALSFMPASTINTTDKISIYIFFPAALFCALLSYLVGRLFRHQKSQQTITVLLESGDTRISIECLNDSGNLLYEPLSGKPVIILTQDKMQEILPTALRVLFRRRDPSLLATLDARLVRRIRLIPATGIGYSGLLWAYLPDRILVNGIEKDAYIAAPEENSTDFSGHEGILPYILIS